MKIEPIPISRVSSEFNTVMRRLVRGDVDVYVLTRSGRAYACLIRYQAYEQWLEALDRLEALVDSLPEDDANT